MKKVRKILTAILTAALVISNMTGSVLKAKAADSAVSIILVGKVDDINGVPGETVHVKLPVRAVGGYIMDPRISVATDGLQSTVKNIALSAEGYSSENPPLGISNSSTTYIEFDLRVKEGAKISTKPINVTVDFNYYNDNDKLTPGSLKVPPINLVISEEKEPAQLTVDNVDMDNVVIGSKANLSFTITNEGGITAKNAYFSIDGYKAAGISPEYSKLKQKIGSDGKLAPGGNYGVTLPVKILTEATAGNKELTVKMTYTNEDGESSENTSLIYVNLETSGLAPKIEVESTKYASELKAGDSFNLVATLRNAGQSTAQNVEVSVGGLSTTGFLPGFTSKTISVKSLKKNDKTDVKIPLIVSNEATAGLKELPLTITYKDKSGVPVTTTSSVYLEVVSAEGVSAEGKPNIVVSNVSQSPEAPNADARVDLSFDLENKSKADISEIKISLVSASGAVISSLKSEPYQYIDKLAGGRKARITMPLKTSDTIPEGTNSIDIKYEFTDAKGKTWSDNTATLYVLNVQNDGVGASKPKLIISNFNTDEDSLRAGSTFKFNFDIKNTHPSVAARNIKVTLSQTDNIFSIVNGSNTFYISNIKAGEISKNTVELRVKADATTKSYPLDITMEYEYEGAKANPTTGQIGENVKETINLQAVENSRPVVDNIVVGSYDSPVVNQPTALTFQFYNMGKSTLSNVKASLEGDYKLSTGNMYFIGNVEAGGQQYAELEVIPTVEGQAKGTLIVTFEDSNGQEVSMKNEFESTIQSEGIPDMGDGMDNPGDIINTAKAPILPVWLFIIIQIVILIIAVPVTRKTVLGLYRKKLRRQEEAD